MINFVCLFCNKFLFLWLSYVSSEIDILLSCLSLSLIHSLLMIIPIFYIVDSLLHSRQHTLILEILRHKFKQLFHMFWWILTVFSMDVWLACGKIETIPDRLKMWDRIKSRRLFAFFWEKVRLPRLTYPSLIVLWCCSCSFIKSSMNFACSCISLNRPCSLRISRLPLYRRTPCSKWDGISPSIISKPESYCTWR